MANYGAYAALVAGELIRHACKCSFFGCLWDGGVYLGMRRIGLLPCSEWRVAFDEG